jgi:hypothetical protein
MMENLKKVSENVSINNSGKWKPEISTKFRFQISKFTGTAETYE